jgi:hypothetical protein
VNILDVTSPAQEFAAMPTSKTLFDYHLSGFMLVAWPTLLAETIYPPLAHDFSYLVAGLLSGYLFVMVKDRQRRHRSS